MSRVPQPRADQLEHFKLAVGQAPPGGEAVSPARRPEKFSKIRADIFSLT